jgi:alcohol dehydrogenase class IV
MGMPAGLTAATGLDALSHCVETFLSPRINPPAEAIALDGARRIWSNLEVAVRDGSNETARWEMMMGSLEGGMTFQKGLGAVHGLSHALGGMPGFHLHHGMLNAIFLPKVVEFNANYVGCKMAALGDIFDCSPMDVSSQLKVLNERIGLPNSIVHLNIPSELDGEIAERAMADHSTATNPRPMSVELYLELLQKSR